MHDQMQPQNQLPNGEVDHEGAMAKADLYKLANYSLKLFKQMDDNAQIEAWVQAKITKAADYMASVYHYLEYEMKFSEYGAKLDNSDVYNEDQKREIKGKLMEAKEKMKALKIQQATKVEEGVLSGGHKTCEACHGTGSIYEEPKEVPAHVKSKVEKYKRLTKATHAASKRLDRNNNGIPDSMEGDKEVAEETSSTGGTITRPSKGVTKHTQNPDRFSDEPHVEPASQAKSKSSAEKKAEKEKDIKLPKHPKDKTWGKKGGENFGKGAKPAKKEKEVEVDENVGQGVYSEAKGDGNLANNAKPYDKVTRGDVIAGRLGKDEKGGKEKKVKEALKGDQKKLDVDGDEKIEKSDLAALRANKKVKEATGSYSAKDAAAGKDLGKPGKNFAKIAKKAGGGEKGEKIAGAVLKNLRKESAETESNVDMLAESVEINRIRFLSGL
jgi:hypothetical protein